ncbi:6-phosphogluconolactonase [Buchnera aphidicola]|uniref:6-phosphogluconolactonase n=1 Tax=Buchnera aphidicola subsp. Acyrthosiphon pisum (strain Tuc7) TaxID=561501 RepID=6PGL_BUCAT|nr:6-phosphogluconolactonase [Buchnera aphidicola]B8D7I7.1 RecName: Full=6-phosphogluconolactonase; Short=6-P-gluconolactonase [Buchnera aphidicola str. Tuc7 (Acyrthosiphon pisum)]ACL30102.1 6-phosphogluconolactonase (YbhE) [Buchnera aphidicola str. Tuc7 (Acyrthosiphon pisum)]ADP66112.1 6-phosphogluconolactonase [Buchnera aphidicola str. LL01 (Acyrthosiphon pisum)]ADP66685.1 6-phosphogluconolactonase [Buchnera aphidicola str. TLW03 (Acyrthosiphon pisum)]
MKQVVYIANSESKNIEVWNLCKSGKMNLIQKIETDGKIQPINIIQKRNLLYAGIFPDNKIITYSINHNGFLEKKNESNIPGKANYISFDKKKEFLFCSSYHSNFISVSPLNKFGIPQNPIQIIYNIEGCHAAKMNYKYNILFVISLKEDCIYLYYLTDFGILKSTEQNILHTQKKSGPRHIIFHPNQDFIYTINELNGTIDVWKIYKKNNVIKVKNIQNIHVLKNRFLKDYWCSDIHITSCGRFLYACDRFFNIISLFHINQNDNKLVFFKSYDTEEQPRSFNINSHNTHLIVAGEKSNTFIIYGISNSTGELKKINVYSTGQRPVWILIHALC